MKKPKVLTYEQWRALSPEAAADWVLSNVSVPISPDLRKQMVTAIKAEWGRDKKTGGPKPKPKSARREEKI